MHLPRTKTAACWRYNDDFPRSLSTRYWSRETRENDHGATPPGRISLAAARRPVGGGRSWRCPDRRGQIEIAFVRAPARRGNTSPPSDLSLPLRGRTVMVANRNRALIGSRIARQANAPSHGQCHFYTPAAAAEFSSEIRPGKFSPSATRRHFASIVSRRSTRNTIHHS